MAFWIPFTQIFGTVAFAENSVAYAESSEDDRKEIYDVVAIVVDKDLFNDNNTYQGITDVQYVNYLGGDDNMDDRIERYARDIQDKNPGTVAKILEYDPSEDTLLSLITALENLYKNGVSGIDSRLAGVVLVGQVPLPVVNKNGNRYISMFPLTDFDDKAFSFNPLTENFERVDSVTFPKPEIWHGLIREPKPLDRESLALFFDKNHLYHEGVPEFANFQKKIFYADLAHEEEYLNEDLFKYYQKYLQDMDDIAYLRYNKKWAADLYTDVMAGFESDGIDTSEIKAETNSFDDMKDLLSKYVIDQYHKQYFDTVPTFMAVANDMAERTGRYDPSNVDSNGKTDSQVVTIPFLIAIKDAFTQAYLRRANDALENALNKIIDVIDEPLEIPDRTDFQIIDLDTGDSGNGSFSNNLVENGKMYINGFSSDYLTSPKQCAPYLGTMYDPTSGEYSTLTRSVVYDNVMTGKTRYGLGINGFALNSTEAKKLSGGDVDHGFVIDDYPEYGLPAFFNKSSIHDDGEMEVGDIILSITPYFGAAYGDGQILSSCKKMHKEFGVGLQYTSGGKTVINTKKDMDGVIDAAWAKVAHTNMGGSDKDDLYCWNSYMDVEFYDDSAGSVKTLRVGIDYDAEYNTNYLVPIYSVSKKSHAYWNNDLAGCFYASTVLHDDRCFASLAKYPVMDPAGSYEPYYDSGILYSDDSSNIKLENKNHIWLFQGPAGFQYPDINEARLKYIQNPSREEFETFDKSKVVYEHQFPVGEKVPFDERSDDTQMYMWHKETFQFQGGRSMEDIDNIYLDGCFNVLPSYGLNMACSGSPYRCAGFIGDDSLYNENLSTFVPDRMNTFINASGAKNQDIPYGGVGVNVPIVKSAYQFTLPYLQYNEEDQEFNFGYFAEHFGLYDGVDNDGDGIFDYEPTSDSFKFDVDEGARKYGFTPDDLNMFGRKILGKNYKWKTPESVINKLKDAGFTDLSGYIYPFGDNNQYVIRISPHSFKKISSLIAHNEPTNYTIKRQWIDAQKITQSLPIDDPRYVAFMDINGDVQTVDYPNLFKSGSLAQFKADISVMATDIFALPNSSKLPKLNGSQIAYIEDALLKVSTESTDENYEQQADHTYKMTSADAEILKDALTWNGFSIDDKHEYILKNNLKNPAGYEALYFVANGEEGNASDYINTSFNKTPLNETDPKFDPFKGSYEEFSGNPTVDENGYSEPTAGDADDGLVYVQLPEFFKELERFSREIIELVSNFDGNTTWASACGPNGNEDEESETADPSYLTYVDVKADKPIALSGGNDSITLTVTATGDKAKIDNTTPQVKLDILQDSANPVFEISETDEFKVLEKGAATYVISTTKNSGKASVSVSVIIPSDQGGGEVNSSDIELATTLNSIQLVTDSGDILTAGSTDEITLTADVLRDGKLDGGASLNVKFSVSDSSIAEIVSDTTVDTVNGVAKARIKAKNKTGIVKVLASVPGDNSFAFGEKDIFVVAGDPSQIIINSDTDTLIANGQSRANLRFNVSDKFGNLVTDSFAQISVTVSGDADLISTEDSDASRDGIQLNTDSGAAELSIQAKEDAETAGVSVTLDSADDSLSTPIKITKSFKILSEANIQILSEQLEIPADGQSMTKITATLTDTTGNIISGYNGFVSFSINDSSYAGFVEKPVEKMTQGKAYVIVKSTTKAGSPEISVSAKGFAENKISIVTLPGDPVKISLTSDQKFLSTISAAPLLIKASLLDKYGNLATQDSADIKFSTTAATSHLVNFIEADSFAVNGVGFAKIEANENSGVVNLIVSSTKNGIENGTLALDIKKQIANISYDEFAPKTLYVNVLGADFYNGIGNDLASSMLYHGQSQAVLSTTASTSDKKRVVYVDGYGQIQIIDPNVSANVVSDDGLTEIKFRDNILNEDIGGLIFAPAPGLQLEIVDDFKNIEKGILVKPLNTDGPEFKLNDSGTSIKMVDASGTLLSVDANGKISTSSEDVSLAIPTTEDQVDTSYFSLIVKWRGQNLGQIMFKQNDFSGVTILSPTNAAEITFVPGFYFRLDQPNGHFKAKDTFSRYSTEFAEGIFVIDDDKEIDQSMKPGFGSVSVENALSDEGVGFKFDNKNLLLFAAGNSVGESNIPYAAETGILLGDPTVRIIPTYSSASGYSPSLGKLLYSGDKTIKQIQPFDYNGDGYQDILILDEDGSVRLLENELSSKNFNDRGFVLKLSQGVLSFTRLDIDDDGFDDLVVGSEKSCIKGEQCLYLYKNNGGHFEREPLNFAEIDNLSKIYDMKSDDLNSDGDDDLIVSDSSGNIYIYWNDDGKISDTGNMLANFGATMTGLELAGDLAVNYSGSPVIKDDLSNETDFVVLTLQNENAESQTSLDDMDGNFYPKNYQFIGVIKDPKFKNGSSKVAVDLNGNKLEIGDIVEYKIKLKNSSSSVNNLILSDTTPSAQEIDFGSLKCLDANCVDNLRWGNSSDTSRAKVVYGISVPANGTRTISYKATVLNTPKVNFNIGDFENGEDEYLDFAITNKSDSESIFYDSVSVLDGNDRVKYMKRASVPSDTASDTPYDDYIGGLIDDLKNFGIGAASEDFDPLTDPALIGEDSSGDDGNQNEPPVCTEDSADYDPETGECGVPGLDTNFNDEIPESVQTAVDTLDEDKDMDGLPDSLAPAGMGGSVTDSLELARDIGYQAAETISQMRCSGGGCVPIPYNYAFLAPSAESSGTAIFAWGTPSFPFVSFMYNSENPAAGRLYLMPTLTMGLGLGICNGPNRLSGVCWPLAIPMSTLLGGVCKSISNSISNAMNEAIDTISSGDNTAALSDGQGDVEGRNSFGGESSPLEIEESHNVKIPGFPKVFTNWIDKMIEEVFNKLLDLPDFYFIFPDVPSLINDSAFTLGKFADIKGPKDFMAVMNQIPIIQIKGQEIPIKIPALSKDQITKWQRQANLFIKNLEDQWKDAKEYWSCDTNSQNKTVCDAVKFKMDVTIENIKKVLDTLEKYKNLPKQILEWRTAQQKYARQIICYLDTVMDVMGGYLKKQSKIIASWIKMINDIIAQFKSWQMIFKLSLDYKKTCDKCTTDRFSKIGILMQLFAAFPDLPTIPLPKWPDFVVDFSKMQLGAEIIWPDLVFTPVPIVLPDLPTIALPKIIPNINVDLDGLIPSFELPWLPTSFELDLPDLPALPIPKFPDLPKPPKIPSLPKAVYDIASDLRTVFKVLCLIKRGLTFIPETSLKDEIEILTEPSNSATIPFIKNLSIKTPEITYEAPSEIDITVKSKFGVSTNAIYQAVKDLADKSNKEVEEYVRKINGYMQNISIPYIENLDQAIKEKLGVPPDINIDGAKIKEKIKGASSDIHYWLTGNDTYLSNDDPLLNRPIEDLDFVDIAQFDDGNLKQVAVLRNNLLSFVKNEEDRLYLASSSDVLPSSGSSGLNIMSAPMVTKESLIAVTGEQPDLLSGLPTVDSNQSTATPPGIYVYGKDGTSENVLYYTDELGKGSHIVFSDTDLDGDDEIIFSMGGDLYLKKNYFNDNESKLDRINSLSSVDSISKYSEDKTLSVQGYITSSDGHNTSTVTFIPLMDPNVVGYEISVIPSLLDMDNKTYRFVLFEKPENVFGHVNNVVDSIDNTNKIEAHSHDVYSAPTQFDVSGGATLHALSSAKVSLKYSGKDVSKNIELNDGDFYMISKDSTSASINLIDGQVEIIVNDGDRFEQTLLGGMGVVYGDNIISGISGGANITFTNGASVEIGSNEKFSVLKLQKSENPSISLEVADGQYYSVIHALTKDGRKSFISTQTPISPQICDDDIAPISSLVGGPGGSVEYYVPVTKKLEINASASFDPNGEIKEFYIDSDPLKDTDGDGNMANDKDPSLWRYADSSSPAKFILGPFEDLGKKNVTLNLVDLANNSTIQPVAINVYVPIISLSPVNTDDSIVSGTTEPPSADMEYALMRKRYGYRVVDGKLNMVLNEKKIATASSDENGHYQTLGDGNYKINDFTPSNIILIYDGSHNVVGEINADTGNFWLSEGYSYSVVTAQPPSQSTYIEIFNPSGKSMGSLYFVSDGGISVTKHQDAEFTSKFLKDKYGVHVNDFDSSDQFEFRSYPANDPNYPNGVYLYYLGEKKQMLAIDTYGNTLILDDRVSISKKANNYKTDPLVLDVNFSGKKIAEIYVSIKGIFDEIQIVGPFDVPSKLPNSVSPSYLFEEHVLTPTTGEDIGNGNNTGGSSGSGNGNGNIVKDSLFKDLSGELRNYAMNLYNKGVISAVENFDPNKASSRADFVITLLNMLCIIPRAEAYDQPAVFSDMPYQSPISTYYPYVKEGALLGIIHGYGSKDNVDGINPFKPANIINMAEAVKIIVQGLALQGVIDLSKVDLNNSSPWYKVYFDIAKNLNKYVKDGVTLKNSYIVTDKEASNPNEPLTRGQLLELAYRVIDAYNCFEIDKDKDNMKDYCESKYDIDDPSLDPDKDGLINSQECSYGTDPNKADTDGDNMKDGDEIKYGTDPLYNGDGQKDTDGDSLLDVEEITIYKTDPKDPDTDDGGINDGLEVKDQTDPLDKKDDYSVTSGGGGSQKLESEAGAYLVPAECDACPCQSTFEYKADLRKGDVLYTIIVNPNETKVYSKSNEEKVQ